MKDQNVYAVCRDKKILCNSDESNEFMFITDDNGDYFIDSNKDFSCFSDKYSRIGAEFHPDFNDKECIKQINGLQDLDITVNGEDFTSFEQFRKAMLNNDSFEIGFKYSSAFIFKKKFYKTEVIIIDIPKGDEICLGTYVTGCYIKEITLTTKKD